MTEVLLTFQTLVVADDGRVYQPRACGAPLDNNLWQGWIEFVATDGEVLRSPRETTQPNREALVYWATGLTAIYLEGALDRALNPPIVRVPRERLVEVAAYDSPATPTPVPTSSAPAPGSVLNPFSVYQKGEAVLRKQLAALSKWHLINIIKAEELSSASEARLMEMSAPALIDEIVRGVKLRLPSTVQP
jgi:hypothetical protein